MKLHAFGYAFEQVIHALRGQLAAPNRLNGASDLFAPIPTLLERFPTVR